MRLRVANVKTFVRNSPINGLLIADVLPEPIGGNLDAKPLFPRFAIGDLTNGRELQTLIAGVATVTI